VSAHLNVHGRSVTARERARSLVEPLLRHFSNGGVGQLPEVFDGEPPHSPGGCFAQAWSVAELVRVLVKELKA
jgi:glycogen debranching enzyme